MQTLYLAKMLNKYKHGLLEPSKETIPYCLTKGGLSHPFRVKFTKRCLKKGEGLLCKLTHFA